MGVTPGQGCKQRTLLVRVVVDGRLRPARYKPLGCANDSPALRGNCG
jgi:hypothetical protein